MKKFRGTKFAHIGTSYTPAMDAEIDRLEAAVLNREARLHEVILQAKGLLREISAEELEHWGE